MTMVFDSLHQPAGPFADQVIFGNSLHGLCVGNVLTRPNGATVSIVPPFDLMSDCLAVRLAGVPDIVRTPEQAAADLADGLVWIPEVLLPGDTLRYWFWRNSSKRTFLIELINQAPLTSVFIRVVPYGEIGAAPETARTSSFAGFTVSGGAGPWQIWDVSGDGSKALIARRTSSPFDPVPGLHRRMLGLSIVVECSLSQGGDGWPVPTVTLVRSSEQCLGAISSSLSESGVAPILVSWREFEGDVLGPYQIAPEGPGVPGSDNFVAIAKNGVESVSTSFTLADRLLSCWYGDGGAVQFLTLSLQRDETGTRDYVHTVAGMDRTISQTSLLEYTASATYTYGGAGLLTESWSGTSDGVSGNPGFPFGMAPNWNGVGLSTMTAIRDQLYLPQINQQTAQTFGLLAFSKKMFAPFHAVGDIYTIEPARHPAGTTPTAPDPVTVAGIGDVPVYIARDPRTGALSSWSSVPVCFI
ncbi:hypothetical protein [Methyloversatilis discipulorum]|uniref:hypothetical protein n=1 Tax=Methyloversatilis discipulorum TaxID=1119528 RepID=UPI0004B11903|nr:hypothetical protein [Methyloversatilis discipulorum]